ncbi:MAG: hypothetical protein ABI947_25115 [Chloroflexota bacterium]
MNRIKHFLMMTFIVILAASALPQAILRAQDSTTVTLTLAVSDFMRDAITDKLIADFEAAHPNIKVSVKSADPSMPSVTGGVDKYLSALHDYASAGDVLDMNSRTLNWAGTQAGYFLDLAPLTQSDPTLNSDDFYPAMWQSFQWDKGIWALPTSAQIVLLSYDPAAFDRTGVAYPNDKWTLDDLDAAIRKLAVTDPSGKITSPGMDIGFADNSLLRALLGEGVYDSSVLPNTPALDKPATAKLLTTWAKLDAERFLGRDFNKAPLSVVPVFALTFSGNTDQKRVGALFPGGSVGFDLDGFAVSAGTLHPQESYELAKFLTTRAEITSRIGTPARKSMAGAQNPDGPSFARALPADLQKLVDQGLANAIPVSEQRYTEYLTLASEKMKSDKLDAESALQTVEAQAAADQKVAAAKTDKASIVVATPVPVAAVAAGKIILNFGLNSFIRPLPNREAWDKLANDFSASDPQVGKVDVTLPNGPDGDPANFADKYDCFYMPYNAVPTLKLDTLLNLDPFLNADSTFDKSDVVGGVMAQLQRDNKTWAMPIMIEPSALKYDTEQFKKAGVPLPDQNWTLDAFNDALKTLKPTLDKDTPPFDPAGPGGQVLLSLIAAYGGLPLDYRTTPVTVKFSDPDTVAAIRQVLDLAKQGYIKYDELAALGGVIRISAGGKDSPITTGRLGGFRVIRNNGTAPADPFQQIAFPRGSKYIPLSYSIGTAYISASTKNADACYRWISTLAKHPELFSAMPARRSLINDPALAATQSKEAVAFYNQIDALLQDPNTITFPTGFGGESSLIGFLAQHWLFEAFDNYVLKSGDLDAALAQAETYTNDFLECAAKIPATNTSGAEDRQARDKLYFGCASTIDPRLKETLGNFLQ